MACSDPKSFAEGANFELFFCVCVCGGGGGGGLS